MKKQGFNTTKALIAAACAASMLTLGACSSDSDSRATTTPGGGGGPVVPPPPPPPPVNLTSALTLTVLDAETGAPFTGSVTVAATGEDALLFTDANSLRGPWTFTGGSIILVAQGIGPIDAILTATAGNYFDSSVVVSYDENTFENRSVTLTPKAFSTPTSIQTATATGSTLGTTGLITTTMTGATTPTADPAAAGTKTSVKVKSGTIMRDAGGNPVTGNVTMNVGFFPNDPNGAAPLGKSPLNAFPGGLDNLQISNPGGGGSTQSGGSFVSGGLIAVEIGSDSGQQVSTFDTPIEVASTISTDTVNPETGLKVKTGDVIPVWSYDEGTGEWTYESTATVGAVDTVSKTANVTFSANHLSYWNLDWYDESSYEECSGGYKTAKITVLDASGNPVSNDWLKVDLRRPGGGWSWSSSFSDGVIQLSYPPTYDVQFTLYEQSTNTVVYQQTVNLCGLGDASVQVGANEPPQVSVTAAPTLACETDTGTNGQALAVNAAIQVFSGSTYLSTQTVSASASETANFSLEANGSYTFKAIAAEAVAAPNNDGNIIENGELLAESTFTATDGLTVSLPATINCFSATGATGGTGTGF